MAKRTTVEIGEQQAERATRQHRYLTELPQQADVALLGSEDMWGLRAASAAGAIPAVGHEWDEDPAAWVRQQRQGDARRGG